MTKKHIRQNPKTSETDVITHDDKRGVPSNEDLITQIKEYADKLGRDKAMLGDLKILARTIKELRYAFKVFTPYRRHRKVSVFGSARSPASHPNYQHAVQFGRRMAEEDWMVLTGAGGGIMEAAHVGCGREMAMGLNIMLPFEQEANPIIDNDPKLVHLKYFFTRKLMFVKEVHAVAIYPGGFGTQDEAYETLTLIQTGKRDLMPIVLIDEPGSDYWSCWLDFVKGQLLKDGFISPEDLNLFTVTQDIEDAVEEILGFYSVYHSMRYVGDKLVIRLHQEPDAALLKSLNRDFKSILESGKIETTGAHPWEADDDHIADLPRLKLDFNRRDLGLLRAMVDRINDELGTEP